MWTIIALPLIKSTLEKALGTLERRLRHSGTVGKKELKTFVVAAIQSDNNRKFWGIRIAPKCSCWKAGGSESLFRRGDSFISQICGYQCYTAPGQPCTRDFCNKAIQPLPIQQQSPKHLTTYTSLCYFCKRYQCIVSWLVMCTVQSSRV